MTRLAVLGAVAAIAYLLGSSWPRAGKTGSVNGARVPARSHDDPMDAVQPQDPRVSRPVVVTLPSSLTTAEVGHIRVWLTDHPDVLLYESQPTTTTQTGPLGPSA